MNKGFHAPVKESPVIKEQDEARSDTFDLPLLGIGEDYPDTLHIIYIGHDKLEKVNYYGTFCIQNYEGMGEVHGVAAFESEYSAYGFYKLYLEGHYPGGKILKKTLDEVRDIAKTRRPPINSVIILDNINKPKVIFVARND